jgi:hypothetical protein
MIAFSDHTAASCPFGKMHVKEPRMAHNARILM